MRRVGLKAEIVVGKGTLVHVYVLCDQCCLPLACEEEPEELQG